MGVQGPGPGAGVLARGVLPVLGGWSRAVLGPVVLVLVLMGAGVQAGCRREGGRGLECWAEGGRLVVEGGQAPPPSVLLLRCASNSSRAAILLGGARPGVTSLQVSGCPLPDCQEASGTCGRLLPLLPSLSSLSLTDASLTALPDTLCGTFPRLSSLNLTGNHVRRASSLGLAACHHLHHLVLDRNLLTSLLPEDIPASLRSLSLAHNRLHSISLPSLPGLSLLDLSSNQLSSLPPALLAAAPALQKLMLQNNSLSSLPPRLLSPLEGLLLLNLSSNHLTERGLQTLLADQVKLIALDLSHNRVSRVERGALAGLGQLQILGLGHCGLEAVEPGGLASLRNLHVLMLEGNRLTELTGAALANLHSLHSLSLNNNRLRALPDNLFSDTLSLEDLSLHHNQLAAIPAAALAPLANLKTLDLGENMISDIGPSDLIRLTKLYGLRLSGNRLTSISGDPFARLASLHVLNLSHNRLASLAAGSLRSLDSLTALRLDSNLLQDLNGLVSSLDSLRWLNVSSNRLQWFDFAFIPKSLEWLDIHNNRVKRIGNYYGLSSGYSLHTFDASFNSIEVIESGSFLANLTHVFLNSNRIASIAAESFLPLGQLARLDLRTNSLSSVSPAGLVTGGGHQPEVLLAGNPWRCDCTMDWLSKSRGGGVARVEDLEALQCSTVGRPDGATQLLVSVPVEEFLCQYETHCQPDCFCCDFFACDCRMQCPDGCDCFHDSQWSVNTIQCSGRGHGDVPALIPMDATEVYLDGNNMTELVSPGFIGRRRVRQVFLNSSQIVAIGPLSLEGLAAARSLHLEHNQLARLIGHEFTGLPQLRELHLQHNRIREIGRSTFSALHRLALLRLDGNRLASLGFVNLPPSAALRLASNPWSCGCEALAGLESVLGRTLDGAELACGGGSSLPLAQTDCSLAPLTQPIAGANSQTNFTPIMIGVLLAIFLVVVVYLAAFTYRRRLKGCLAAPAAARPSLEGRLFDLFLTYSLEDRRLAEDTLAPALEQGPGTSYRLCLHQRDFPVSTPLHDSITVAAESSARTLLLLSPSFVATQWPLVRGPLLSLPPGRLLVLQLAPLAPAHLAPHPELRQLLETGPVLRWGEPDLWPSLRGLLPEPAYLTFRRTVTLRSRAPAGSLLRPPPAEHTDGWTYYMEESSTGTVETNSTEMSTDGSARGSPSSDGCLEHTYYSIHDTSGTSSGTGRPVPHHYHTLEPGRAGLEGGPGPGSLFTIVSGRRNLLA